MTGCWNRLYLVTTVAVVCALACGGKTSAGDSDGDADASVAADSGPSVIEAAKPVSSISGRITRSGTDSISIATGILAS